jgi:hypothetical protein
MKSIKALSAKDVWKCLSRELQEGIVRQLIAETVKGSILLKQADEELILQRYFQGSLAFRAFEAAFHDQNQSHLAELVDAFKELSTKCRANDDVIGVTSVDGEECMQIQRDFFAWRITDLKSVRLLESAK